MKRMFFNAFGLPDAFHLTFRLRVLALVSLVALTAIGATAYLAFVQASRQATESATADNETSAWIIDEITQYGVMHGTWEGVAGRVRELSERTGQRIRLVTEYDEVVVDSDTLQERTARRVIGPPSFVDARPALAVRAKPVSDGTMSLAEFTLRAIAHYRSNIRFAACLTRHGLGVVSATDEYGFRQYAPSAGAMRDEPQMVAACGEVFAATDGDAEDAAQVAACGAGVDPTASGPGGDPDASGPDARSSPISAGTAVQKLLPEAACLSGAYARRTASVGPVPLLVYLGSADDPRPPLTPGPVIAAAGLVALLTVAGTIVLSRRVLRPIQTLTAASRRFADGDWSPRVAVQGRDELAELAVSFNRMADSLQRGEERQRRMVADVAHELRTPLANLRGYLEALKDGVLPASPEVFASLHEEAVLQQRIVDDLQDLALAEAGVLAYQRSRTDLAELLETCRIAHQAAADTAGVALRVTVDGPVTVYADPDRLRQVIGNLISNALRATPAGGSVALSAAGPVNGNVTIEVRDSGTGISAADLDHVFDRFWRADAARSRTTGGSGLGLAIARQIVTDHNGQIGVTSQPGAGTTVTIRLPEPAQESVG